MAAVDGYIEGVRTVATVREDSQQVVLVFVSDGYRKDELTKFRDDVDAFWHFFCQQPPFDSDEVRERFNVYRIDVASTDSGADHPACADSLDPRDPCKGPIGRVAATYFDSTFCYGSARTTHRLLYGDTGLLIDTVVKHVPGYDQIVVLVNDPERGGGGGRVAWSSTGGEDWLHVVLHELGHSLFGLADEYDYGDPEPLVEPTEPNVTIEADPLKVKWNGHFAPGQPVPTWPAPDCDPRTTTPAPPAAVQGPVGIFEGAKYTPCGMFRPTWSCKMRVSTSDFCPVCVAEIMKLLALPTT